jgi:hypothetical protein
MSAVMFGHPGLKIPLELIWVSVLASFDCSPSPAQSCKLIEIGQVTSAGGGIGLASG